MTITRVAVPKAVQKPPAINISPLQRPLIMLAPGGVLILLVIVLPLLVALCISLSVLYAVIVSVVTTPIGIAAALATQQAFRGRGLVRSLFLIPYVLPAFVVGTIWRIILLPDGFANRTLAHAGIHPGLWLNGPKSFWALVLVDRKRVV